MAYSSNYDVILISRWRHQDSAKILSTTIGYSIVAMVTDQCPLLSMIREEHGIQCMPCSSQILSEIYLKFIQWKSVIFSNL